MKVKEVMEKLAKMNPDAELVVPVFARSERVEKLKMTKMVYDAFKVLDVTFAGETIENSRIVRIETSLTQIKKG